MTPLKFIILFLLLSLNGIAQRTEPTRGEWSANGKTLTDPKVGVIKLIRVKHDSHDFGTFLALKDSSKMSLYYSPMCGNDCFWRYEGKHTYDGTKLTLKFNTYSQHGFCKNLTKSYRKDQMNFVFKVQASGKDTLVLTRQQK